METVFLSVVENATDVSFVIVKKRIQKQLSRALTWHEVKEIEVLYKKHVNNGVIARRAIEEEAFLSSTGRSFYDLNFCVLTAYSEDYPCGPFCSATSQYYARKYGYTFKEVVDTKENILNSITPKNHCTWLKIKLIIEILREELANNMFQYLLWVDADAMITNYKVDLKSIVSQGQQRDLIFARDANKMVPLNAGVFLVRVSPRMLDFFNAVWSITRYDKAPFYEQSAIIKQLKLQYQDLSTNLGSIVSLLSMKNFNCPMETEAKFIFHPAGKKGKFDALKKCFYRIQEKYPDIEKFLRSTSPTTNKCPKKKLVRPSAVMQVNEDEKHVRS